MCASGVKPDEDMQVGTNCLDRRLEVTPGHRGLLEEEDSAQSKKAANAAQMI